MTTAFDRGMSSIRRIGFAEARMLRCDHLEPGRQRLHERQPRGAARAMEDDECPPGTAAHQADVAAADRDFGGGGVGHGRVLVGAG